METIGTITLGKEAMISDPCYGTGMISLNDIIDVAEGEYAINISRNNEGVIEMMSAKKIDTKEMNKCRRLKSYVGVDSGTMSIIDYDEYIKHHSSFDIDEKWYKETINKNIYNMPHLLENGVICNSGYGDGEYPLYVRKDKSRKICEIMIVFIGSHKDFEL